MSFEITNSIDNPFVTPRSMVFPSPEYSRSQVTWSGKYISEFDWSSQLTDETRKELLHAIRVFENWRLCHGYALNTFKVTLRARAAKVCKSPVIAQRLKRMPTILDKLKRHAGMNLARMQDIGGLRAIVTNSAQVEHLRNLYVNSKAKNFCHELVREYDYLKGPKYSGYRGVHLVYRYKNPKSPAYDGLQLELQLRSKLQHVWATAVETMGTITKNALKSSQGPTEWLDFFALTSSAFALIEKKPPLAIHSKISPESLYQKIREIAHELRVVEKMQAINVAASHITKSKGLSDGHYHLIVLNPDPIEGKPFVQIKPFYNESIEQANREYMDIEKEISETKNDKRQAVLVSAGSIRDLKKAYPNFFLDVDSFLFRVKKIVNA